MQRYYFNAKDVATHKIISELNDKATDYQSKILDTQVSYLICDAKIVPYQSERSFIQRYALQLKNQILGFKDDNNPVQIIDKDGNSVLYHLQNNDSVTIGSGTNYYVMSSDETKLALDKGMYADFKVFEEKLANELIGMSYTVQDKILVREYKVEYQPDIESFTTGIKEVTPIKELSYGTAEGLYSTQYFDKYSTAATMTTTLQGALNRIDFSKELLHTEQIAPKVDKNIPQEINKEHGINLDSELHLGDDTPSVDHKISPEERTASPAIASEWNQEAKVATDKLDILSPEVIEYDAGTPNTTDKIVKNIPTDNKKVTKSDDSIKRSFRQQISKGLKDDSLHQDNLETAKELGVDLDTLDANHDNQISNKEINSVTTHKNSPSQPVIEFDPDAIEEDDENSIDIDDELTL